MQQPQNEFDLNHKVLFGLNTTVKPTIITKKKVIATKFGSKYGFI